jgi:hypothetical protein
VKTRLTFDTVRELALVRPGVEDGTSYRTPALKVKKKLLARLREDNTTVAFHVSFDDREILMRARPKVFFLTDHYRDYPYVLVDLTHATKRDLANIVEIAWKFTTGK